MKKINIFLLLIAILYAFNLEARRITVSSVATLYPAFNGALDKDTIAIKPGTYSMGSSTSATGMKMPKTGLIVLESASKDTMPILQMEMGLGDTVPDNSVPKRLSLIFRNLHLQGRYGNFTTASAYIVSLEGKYISIDTLAFRNCEISNASRCLFRDGQSKGYKSGNMEWLEVTNCLVHLMNSSGNTWPFIYLGHETHYVNIRNNTFFDTPYAKAILNCRVMTGLTGTNSVVNFENNTVACTWASTAGVISTGSYMGTESVFNINNNMFLTPNWSDTYNLKKDTVAYITPAILKCVGGIITAHNNVVDSLRPWLAGQTIDVNGNGAFIAIDTLNTYKMRNLNFSWGDFVDPVGNDFSYLSTKMPATSGVDGKVIGDPRWVKKFTNPRTLNVSANIPTAVVTPVRQFYENGATATVTASPVDGYRFNGWKNKADGTLISSNNPYTFSISSDMSIQADYSFLQVRNVAITVTGSKSASYTITPKKTTYYEGDVITLAVNKHYINDFLGWSDGNKDLTRTVTISGGDLSLSANFSEHPYILAWDFSQLTANNQTFKNLAANFAASSTNPGQMNYVMTDTIRTVSTRNNKFTGVGQELANCVARKTTSANFANPDYLYIRFSTKGLSNLKVKSDIATDNAIFKVQKMQYALDGKNYTDFALDTIKGDYTTVWMHFEGKLPVAAENQDSVSVRWIADTNTERLFATGVTASDFEYAYISKIIVIDNNFTAVRNIEEPQNFKVYTVANKLIIQGESNALAEIYTVMGQKIRETRIETGYNRYAGFNPGIYLVKIGTEVHKVLIK
jgi:hypothetical protein